MNENESTMGDMYELDELLGAYALDAVEHDERGRVEDYLRINPRAAAEVQEHREVATMLAFTGMDAPDGIWSKITAEIEVDAPTPGPELAKVFAFDPPVSVGVASETSLVSATTDATVARGEHERSRRPVGTWMLAAAAAVVLAVAGTVVLTGSQDMPSNDPIADAFDRAADDRDSVRTELVAEGSQAAAVGIIDQDGHGYLDAAALPRLDADRTYQLWGVLESNGDVVSLGILGRNPELETFTIEGDVSALAVTIEMAPGVISDGNSDGAFVGAFG